MEIATELLWYVEQGLVRTQQHPTLPLTIYNYAERVQYDKLWDEVLLQCRGLVMHGDTVVARPFRKFFNDHELRQDEIPWHLPCEITEKMDGSLLIVFWFQDQWVFATRGSFVSRQALEGERIIRSKYLHLLETLDTKCTYLFELIVKWNRIVLDYGETEDVVLLGVIETQSGEEHARKEIGFKNVAVVNLPAQAWVLPSRTSPEDRSQHNHQERVEVLPAVSKGIQQEGLSASRGETKKISFGMAEVKQGSCAAKPQGDVSENTTGSRGCEASSVQGLRGNISGLCNGLRPCEGDEVAECREIAKPCNGGGGNSEVRSGMRELPPNQDLQPQGVCNGGEVHWLKSLKKIIRDDQEGYVVRFSNGYRMKVKGEKYFELHRIYSGISSRMVWEYYSQRKPLDEILDVLPDEFAQWVKDEYYAMGQEGQRLKMRMLQGFCDVIRMPTRKEQDRKSVV